MECVSRLLEIAVENPLSLTPHTFMEISHRVRDKRVNIRRHVILWLAKIFQKYISLRVNSLESLNNGSPYSGISNELWIRLNYVPSLVIQYWAFPEAADKSLTLKVLLKHNSDLLLIN
jgi:hypothetical protein